MSTLNDEEFGEFKRAYEVRVLPAIIQALDQANIVGGQVLVQRRKTITIVTREEAPPSLKSQIEQVVAAQLREDIRAKISLEFATGHLTTEDHICGYAFRF
ncbi:hypothetical protein F5B22DRAFT_648256 [Xylaria bambusicola]|uniref:uncharacterized protein n=1 Tax=Xylaria bambusicola TaxID=326684 RepID=UPI002008E590|nr:uncharacterized protein F5B22DRAFT_648256 [Xylaria bambusicola]KAI0512905.1 hypothetical protein F5B22DRAFT_648256 [Xylaria bambusicola]